MRVRLGWTSLSLVLDRACDQIPLDLKQSTILMKLVCKKIQHHIKIVFMFWIEQIVAKKMNNLVY
jgi:hypothetical protein